MQIQRGQTRIAAFGLAGGEKAATVGEGQQVAGQRTVPAAVGHARGQHAVEQVAARRREHPRATVALLRQGLALGPVARLVEVAAVETEALQTEVVGDASGGDVLQTLLQRLALGL
ncbi:hypothetical protein D3C78_1275740 [compost metagenome]